MSRRKPPRADKAGGGQPPVASAPDLAQGLIKYYTPSLLALTSGADAPQNPPAAPANPVRRLRPRRLTFLIVETT